LESPPATRAATSRGLYGIKNNDLGGLTTPLSFAKGQPPDVPNCFFILKAEPNRVTAPFGSKRFCYG
jgi:hypothetical protein